MGSANIKVSRLKDKKIKKNVFRDEHSVSRMQFTYLSCEHKPGLE